MDRIKIDEPIDHRITKPASAIRGWLAIDGCEMGKFHFQIGSFRLPHIEVTRPDVEDSIPGYSIYGFQIQLDLGECLPYIQNNTLVIELMIVDYYPFSLPFTIGKSALTTCISGLSDV